LVANVPDEQGFDDHLLGLFRFRLTLQAGSEKDDPQIAAEFQLWENAASYVATTQSWLVSSTGDSLRVLVVPPPFPTAHPSIPVLGGVPVDQNDVKQIFHSTDEVIQIGTFGQQLLGQWQRLELAGAIGDWTFFLLDTASGSRNERLERVKRLEESGFKIDKLMMYYVEVPLN
jgi:hypothetical protein